MTLELTKAQLRAIGWVIASILLVTIAPVIVTAIYGKAVPDSLIAMSDKTVTGLIGVLGTLAGAIAMRAGSKVEPTGTPTDPVSTRDVG